MTESSADKNIFDKIVISLRQVGVKALLISSYMILLCLTFYISLVAVQLFQSSKQHVDNVVSTKIDALMMVNELALTTESLTDFDVRILLSSNLQELIEQTLEYFDKYEKFQQQLERLNQNSEYKMQLSQLKALGELITLKMKKMDFLSANRISSIRHSRQLLASFQQHYKSAKKLINNLLIDENLDTYTRQQLIKWRENKNEIFELLLSISLQSDPKLSTTRRESVQIKLNNLSTIESRISPDIANKIHHESHRLSQLITGMEGFFYEQDRAFNLSKEIERNLVDVRELSESLHLTALDFVKSIRFDVLDSGRDMSQNIVRAKKHLSLLLIMIVIVTIVIIFYIQHRVMNRLGILQGNMKNYLKENSPVTDISGYDEINSIHNSFKKMISRVEVQQKKLEELALTDELTGIGNRRYFMSNLEVEVERCRRTGSKASVIMLDIDHFKSINDQYGHNAGDIILKQVVGKVSENVRATDSLGRIGGEEFAILVVNTGAQDAGSFAERVRRCIENSSVSIDGKNLQITVSFGVSEIRPSTDNVKKLLARADEALYKAKEGGRNRVSIY